MTTTMLFGGFALALLGCVGCVACVACVGCEERARPWEQGPDASAPDPGPPPSARAPLIAPADGGPEPERDGGPATGAAEEPAPPARVGGPWVRCYGNFSVSGEPLKDLTRLTLLCGPENGMARLSKAPLEGAVTEGGAAVSTSFPAMGGDCYRVFAVAEKSVADLDVVVRSSRGSAIAADHGEDAWPVVQPDRPFCALDDDTFTVDVTAKRGSGRFAAEVWRLPAGGP